MKRRILRRLLPYILLCGLWSVGHAQCPDGGACASIDMGSWSEGDCDYFSVLWVCACGTCNATFQVCSETGSSWWNCDYAMTP